MASLEALPVAPSEADPRPPLACRRPLALHAASPYPPLELGRFGGPGRSTARHRSDLGLKGRCFYLQSSPPVGWVAALRGAPPRPAGSPRRLSASRPPPVPAGRVHLVALSCPASSQGRRARTSQSSLDLCPWTHPLLPRLSARNAVPCPRNPPSKHKGRGIAQ